MVAWNRTQQNCWFFGFGCSSVVPASNLILWWPYFNLETSCCSSYLPCSKGLSRMHSNFMIHSTGALPKKTHTLAGENEVGDNQARVGWSYWLFWVGNFTYTKLQSPCNDAIIRNLWQPWVCLELSSLNWDGSMNIVCMDDTPVRIVGQGIDVQTILIKLSHRPNLIPPPPASPASRSYPFTTAHFLSNAPPRMLRGAVTPMIYNRLIH